MLKKAVIRPYQRPFQHNYKLLHKAVVWSAWLVAGAASYETCVSKPGFSLSSGETC